MLQKAIPEHQRIQIFLGATHLTASIWAKFLFLFCLCSVFRYKNTKKMFPPTDSSQLWVLLTGTANIPSEKAQQEFAQAAKMLVPLSGVSAFHSAYLCPSLPPPPLLFFSCLSNPKYEGRFWLEGSVWTGVKLGSFPLGPHIPLNKTVTDGRAWQEKKGPSYRLAQLHPWGKTASKTSQLCFLFPSLWPRH